MPNWCSTSYVIEGDRGELKELYSKMHELETIDVPLLENGFGNTWLGCLVGILGGSCKNISCRGAFFDLEFDEENALLRFDTETAWSPCKEVENFLKDKFESIDITYIAEEPGCGIYETNDKHGVYFTERYKIDYMISGNGGVETYDKLEHVLEFMKIETGEVLETMDDVLEVCERINKDESDEYADDYIYVKEIEIMYD